MPTTSAILQPFWLKPGYINESHRVYAANKLEKRSVAENADDANESGDTSQSNGDNESVDFLESSQSSGKPKVSRTGPVTRDEIANEAATMLYKRLTSVLHRSRVAAKVQLFHDIMYVFTSWSHHGSSVDQSTLKISWETTSPPSNNNFDDIPRTRVNRAQDRHSSLAQEVNDTDLHNIEKLEALVSAHAEMSLKVQHDVTVNGSSRRVMYRLNIIEVACRALSSYTTLQSAAKAKDILCVDRRSLKGVMTLAIGLRRLLERAIADHTSTGTIPWRNNNNPGGKRGRPKCRSTKSTDSADVPVTQYKFKDINGLSIDQLLPPPSKQKELLGQMILNLTAEEFDAKLQTVGHSSTLANDDTASPVSGTDGNQIAANESQGVFGF